MNQNFDKKIKTMENFFNAKNLPKIEDYDNIINNTHYLFRKNLSNRKITNSFKKDKFEYDRNSLDNQKEIFESFNIAYLNKKIIWEQEDKKRELLKKEQNECFEALFNYPPLEKQIKELSKVYKNLFNKMINYSQEKPKLIKKAEEPRKNVIKMASLKNQLKHLNQRKKKSTTL